MEQLENGWEFFQQQILGMHWIRSLMGELLQVIGLEEGSKIYSFFEFFLYDSIKIMILLCVLIFLISFIQSYFPPHRTKRLLGGVKGLKGRMLGATFGILTPFCSCSSIPLFIGFTSAGLPIGVTLSFLIMSPMADLGSFTILLSLFGWKIGVAYLVTGFIIAVVGGTIIEKMGMEKYIEDFVKNVQVTDQEEETLTLNKRIYFAKDGVLNIVKRVWPYILIGVGIGSLIHNVIPEELVQGVLGGEHWYSVLLAALVGIPMYADIFGAIPIAEGLLFKGAGLGTVITFMMSVTALSLPSMVMLKKVMKPKLLFSFIIIVAIGIICMGYLFNMFSYLFI